MNKTKRFMSCLILGCMVTSTVSFGAAAADEQSIITTDESVRQDAILDELDMNVVPVQITYYNEIEEVLRMREATPQELREMNISQEEANEIAELDIEGAYYERAQLPESQLRAYGYTYEQIAILKAYDGSTITSDTPVVAASASCTGSASKVSASTSKIAFKYTWTWSSAPLFMRTDKVAVKWKAYNANSVAIDVNCSKSTTVNYYWLSSGNYNCDKNPTTSLINMNEGCSADVVMQYAKENNGNADSIWAKKGTTTVTLTKSSTNISYIKFSGSYGHAYVGFEGGISVGGEGISISFTPTTQITTYATVNKKLTSSGVLSNL